MLPYSDRNLTTTTSDTTINACFANCTDNEFCPAFNMVDVTFVVNMQEEETNTAGVYVAGGGFGETGSLMSDANQDDIWEVTLQVNSSSDITWKFRNGPGDGNWGGAWEDGATLLAGGCASGTYNDRIYSVGTEDVTLDTVCFSKCYDCASNHAVDVTFNVDMTGVSGFDGSSPPYVFGSFNNWDNVAGSQTSLTDADGDNVYSGMVSGLMSLDSTTFLFGFGANYESVPDTCGIYDATLGGNVRIAPIYLADTASVFAMDTIAYGGCSFDVDLSADDADHIIPEVFSFKTYPNPFNPSMTVYYELPMNEFVQIEVFNVLGQKVVTLVNELQIPGQYQYTWNGKNGYGRALQSGIYFVMIKHTTGIEISKVTFLK